MISDQILKHLKRDGLLDLKLELDYVKDDTAPDHVDGNIFEAHFKNKNVRVRVACFRYGFNVTFSSRTQPKEKRSNGIPEEPSFFLSDYLNQIEKMDKSTVSQLLDRHENEPEAKYVDRVLKNISKALRAYLIPVIDGKEWPNVYFDWEPYK